MLRLAAPPPQRLEQATLLDVKIGGTEANVAAACARLGLRTAFISALPADHAWGDRTVRELTGHGVDCAGVIRRPSSRMGLYFLEYGAAPRPLRPARLRAERPYSRRSGLEPCKRRAPAAHYRRDCGARGQSAPRAPTG